MDYYNLQVVFNNVDVAHKMMDVVIMTIHKKGYISRSDIERIVGEKSSSDSDKYQWYDLDNIDAQEIDGEGIVFFTNGHKVKD